MGTATDVVIPTKIDGKSVTKLGTSTFLYKNIKNVILPDTITEIGNNAFTSSGLESIVIPNSVKNIEPNAFKSAKSLKEVEIPGSVKTIGTFAFSDTTALSKLTIDEGVETIAAHAFENSSVATSSGNTYYISGGSLEHLELPSSIKSIGDYAFQGNRLRTVDLSKLSNNVQMGINLFIYNARTGLYYSSYDYDIEFTYWSDITHDMKTKLESYRSTYAW